MRIKQREYVRLPCSCTMMMQCPVCRWWHFFTETVFTDVSSQLHPCHPLLHPTPLLPQAVPKHGQILQQGICLIMHVSLVFYVHSLYIYT